MLKAAGQSLPRGVHSSASSVLSLFPLCLFSPDFSCLMSSKPAWLLRDPQLQKQAGVDFKSAENFRSESNGKKSWYVTLGLCCSHQVQSTHPVYRCPACMDLGVQRVLCVRNSHCGHGVLCAQLLLCAHIRVCMNPHVFTALTMCIDFHMCVNLPMHRFPRVHSSHYTDPCLCKLLVYEWIPIIYSSYCAHGSPFCTAPTVCTDPHLYIVYCALFPRSIHIAFVCISIHVYRPSSVHEFPYMCRPCMDSPMRADLYSFRGVHTIHRAFPQEERGQSLPHSSDNKAGVSEPQVVSWVLPTLLQGTQ